MMECHKNPKVVSLRMTLSANAQLPFSFVYKGYFSKKFSGESQLQTKNDSKCHSHMFTRPTFQKIASGAAHSGQP